LKKFNFKFNLIFFFTKRLRDNFLSYHQKYNKQFSMITITAMYKLQRNFISSVSGVPLFPSAHRPAVQLALFFSN